VIDAFVESLDLKEMGFDRMSAAREGRPIYPAKPLLKLYLYGNRKQIRSSRRLEEACVINMEAKWLMEGMEPDFRTISDFRKDNIGCMKKVFRAFNIKLFEALKSGFSSIDGSKFRAWNSKDNNFTATKLDERIERLNRHTDEYLRQMEEIDKDEDETEIKNRFTREELEDKLRETKERLSRYEGYRKHMEENGLSQLSLTDPDARLMKSNNGFEVAYNVQTAVDSETHLISDFQITNQSTDHGLLASTVAEIRDSEPTKILEVTADKGYIKEEDIVKCLENGIIPHVIPQEGQDVYELELSYEEGDISEEIRTSTESDDLKKCLRSGVIPEAYKGYIESTEIIERTIFVRETGSDARKVKSPYANENEMKARAAQGYFVRDSERNCVYCPCGEILRQKCVKANGNIRYANKRACQKCPNREKCYKSKNKWNEVDFGKDTFEKPCKLWLLSKGAVDDSVSPKREGHYEKKKFVRITFRPDRRKMDKRKCLSEHPFGTVKRWMNAGYYLLCGMRKTEGETALFFLGYNMVRAMNLLGFKKMIEIMN
jgi:transposase